MKAMKPKIVEVPTTTIEITSDYNNNKVNNNDSANNNLSKNKSNTSQIINPGLFKGSMDDLVTKVYQYCRNINKQYKIKERKKKRIHMICPVKSCEFRVIASRHKDDCLYITSNLCLSHTCTQGDLDKMGRTRTVNSGVLMNISKNVSSLVNNDGNFRIKELISAAKEDGIELKTGQAHKIMKRKRGNPIGESLASYSFLQPYLNLLKREDKDGEYILTKSTQNIKYNENNNVRSKSNNNELNDGEVKLITENSNNNYQKETAEITIDHNSDESVLNCETMQCCYIAWSATKNLWSFNRKFIILDSIKITSHVFQHHILTAVTKDNNDEPILLAYAIVDKVNATNWSWFINHLINSFAGNKFFVGVYLKENMRNILRLCDEHNIKYLRCVENLVEACRVEMNIPLPNNINDLVLNLAKAHNDIRYSMCLKELNELSPAMAGWLNSHQSEFSNHSLNSNSILRYDEYTIETAQSFNLSFFSNILSLNITMLMIEINKKMAKLFNLRYNQSLLYKEEKRMMMTPFVFNCVEKQKEIAKNFSRVEKNNDGECSSAQITNIINTTYIEQINIKVNHKKCIIDCSCEFWTNYHIPCCHAIVLMKPKEFLNLGYYDHLFIIENFIRQYNAKIPNTTLWKEIKRIELLPPITSTRAKVPIRSNKRRRYNVSVSNPRVCRLCNQSGHFSVTCKNPNINVIIKNYRDEAAKFRTVQSLK